MPHTRTTRSDALRAERDRLALLLDITNVLVSRRDLAGLLQGVSESLGRALAHDYVSVVLFDGSMDRARVRLVMLDRVRREPLEGRAIAISHENRERFAAGKFALYDMEWLAAHDANVATVLRPLGLTSFCSAPLTTSRGQLGIINVGSRRTNAFDDDDASTLLQVSGQIAIAVENTLAYEEIQRLTDQVMSEKAYLEDEIRATHDFTDIIGQSAAIRRALEAVETVAPTGAAVLLTGETGTGKELVARAIHDRSAARGAVRSSQ